MKLPEEISEKILQILEMPGLDQTAKTDYAARLQVLRKQMRKLADDFTAYTPSEERYKDAYFAYNFPMNLAKTIAVTKEIESHYPGILAGRTRVNVIDIGCGDGAGICGLYYGLKDTPSVQEFKFTGVDRSPKMLERARILGRWLGSHDKRVKTRFRRQKVVGPDALCILKQYDVIICINALAEIIEGENIPIRFVHSLLARLTDDGLLVIIEPALKKFVRRLMRLRDEIVSQRKAAVLLPCLHENPCALLMVDSRDEWCHQSVRWSPPELLRIINQGLNREIDVLKFAYLVIARGQIGDDKPDGYRVISELLREKGKSRCYICAPQGRVELVRLSRSRTAHNACFDSVGKGDILKLENVNAKKRNYWQILEQTKVEFVK
jgi:ribosomal protein RSM22 (predicted rRNA methylase)